MSELLGPDAYVDDVLAALTPLPATDVPVAAAHGLVLAQDVTAALPVPPCTNSAMDRYAVRARDTAPAAPRAPVVLPVSGDVPAGSVPAPLVPGTAQRIMTGAVLPEGADAVVRVEDTDQESGPRPLPAEVEVRAVARAGLNVRRAGEDVGVGDRVLAAGCGRPPAPPSPRSVWPQCAPCRDRGSPSCPPAPSSSIPAGRCPPAPCPTPTPCCWRG